MNMIERMKAAIVRAARRFDKWAQGEMLKHPLAPLNVPMEDDPLHPMNVPFEDACTRPPPGWMCTRPYGHGGPCATVQLAEPAQSFDQAQWDSLKAHDSTHLQRGSVPPVYITSLPRRPLVQPEQRSTDEKQLPPHR